MAKKKNLSDLKKELLDLQAEIKIREDTLKQSIGGVVLSKYDISSVSDFIEHYKIIRVDRKDDEKQNELSRHDKEIAKKDLKSGNLLEVQE